MREPIEFMQITLKFIIGNKRRSALNRYICKNEPSRQLCVLLVAYAEYLSQV
jgi:hypothetical protein